MDKNKDSKLQDSHNEGGLELTKKERQRLRREEKLRNARREARRHKMQSYGTMLGIGLVVAGAVYGMYAFGGRDGRLPPITQQGHSESSPQNHIALEPIPDAIQRHMLEHSDGSGPSGIIIQYNCDDYDCDPELLGQLAELVEGYPQNVYLAPNTYGGEIILTRLGRRLILDGFDEGAIIEFIETE